MAARTEWEAADRHFQGLPIGRQDAKAVRSLILRRSLLLMGSRTGKLAEVVIVSRGAGRTPMGLIAAMLSIPFNDPDFTAPDLPVATLTGHRDTTRCVAALPPLPFGSSLVPVESYGVEGADGSTNSVLGSNGLDERSAKQVRFITGGQDTMVKVWVKQGSTWSVEADMGEHGNLVWCVAVLPLVKDADGSTKVRFVTGSHDKTMKVWVENSPGTWSVEATLKDRGFVLCMAVLPDGRFVTGSSDWTVKVWKENTPGKWSVEATLKGHLACVNCVAVLPDGRLATGSSDKRVKVWVENSPGRWSAEATLKGHSHYVHCVAVLADGRLATGCTVMYDDDERLVIVWG